MRREPTGLVTSAIEGFREEVAKKPLEREHEKPGQIKDLVHVTAQCKDVRERTGVRVGGSESARSTNCGVGQVAPSVLAHL